MSAYKNQLIATSVLLIGAMLFSTTGMLASAHAQVLPSQRYHPSQVRQEAVPPSVHVPPQQSRPLAATAQQGQTRGAHYTFSDQAQQKQVDHAFYQRGTIAQTSYAAPVDQNATSSSAPSVPTILKDPAESLPAEHPAASPRFTAPKIAGEPIGDRPLRRSPADFAAGMNQVRSALPRIAPAELASEKDTIARQMAEIREKAKQRQAAEIEALKSGVAKAAEAMKATEVSKSTAVATAAPARSTNELRTADARSSDASVEIANSGSAVAEKTSSNEDNDLSASEFVRRISAQSKTQSPIAKATPAEHRREVPAADSMSRPTARKIAASAPRIGEITTTEIRQVSSESYVDDRPDASIRLAAPAISVETFGPKSVGVNKPAVYQVKVHNSSHTDADRLVVGVKLPSWVDIENVNLTSGSKEVTDGTDRARLVWNVDHIPGKSSQTITITAIPRKAEMFDMAVEWTLVPRTGKANVQVTEPRLEMNISGPKEVQFGEKALYHVTVRNPGTGTAENVTVMLPEALGGERASLGDIEPGKEKNFQVELLARTAGDLNLVATATGEGNLKVSADRKLMVRRANLEIALQGPALKYAGSVGRYQITLSNTGDATANDVVTAVALPSGVKFLGGIDSVKIIEGGLRWPVGSIDPGQVRTYEIDCQLDASGDLQLEVGARGNGDLAASSACLTTVETIADLVLTVADPKGPLPTGEMVMYEIRVRNRGSRAAKGINLVMQFSEGIEPHDANGVDHRIVPGQVLFSPIPQINPGQEMAFKVNAQAFQAGTHIFRAQLTCEDSDAREIAEGTTRFFGEDLTPPPTATANAGADSNEFSNDFTR